MIQLLYAGNRNAFDGILISLMSMLKYTRTPVHVWLLTMDLTDVDSRHAPLTSAQRDYLQNMLQEAQPDSRVSLLDVTELFRAEMLRSPNMDSFYTPFCLIRLYADELPELPDRLIYLDTDTMMHDDLTALWQIDLGDCEIGAVEDYLGRVFKYRGYVNSGVLLLNLPQIRQTGLFRRTRARCAVKKSWFPDQDALNQFVRRKKMLDTRFNSQRRLEPDTVIQHFCKSIRWLPFYHTINVKPWEVDRVHSELKITAYDDILQDYLCRKPEIDALAMREQGGVME